MSVPEAGCWPEAFRASLQKIELAADRHGNVNMPRLLLPAETGEEMRAELESQGSAYQDKGETLLRQKANEARRKNPSASPITRVSTHRNEQDPTSGEKNLKLLRFVIERTEPLGMLVEGTRPTRTPKDLVELELVTNDHYMKRAESKDLVNE